MATSILTVLSNVPWGQVLDAAPKVAESATKLWNSVARRKSQEDGIAPTQPDKNAQTPSLQEVSEQVAAMQASVTALKEEMQAATELIKALAEQNTALVQRIELNRKRLIRQTAALAIVSSGLLVSVIYLLLKQ